jgi:vitamin B12/bleomycin/antimicrobial peptide transport system ATP-binding/permease protein
MTQPPSETAPGTGGADLSGKDSLFSQVMRMTAALLGSRERNTLLTLAAGLIVVIAATAYAQIRLNAWNEPFYDALTHKNVPQFLRQLGVFAVIAGILLVLNVVQTWLNQTSRVVLRQGLVHDLFDAWLQPRRAFRLASAGPIGQNPDQRLHADAQHLTDLTTDLGIGLLQATVLLLSFIGVLWMLSQQMLLPIGGGQVRIPGYMVWCALLYAGLASLVSWLVGRPLVTLDADRYAREAELRFGLVRLNEEIEGVTIYGGEADEKEHLNGLFEYVLAISRRIVGALTRLTWVTAGYGWFTIVAPILVVAPSYLTSQMTFGQLMVAVGAFNQVQSSLRWFIDNFSSIADWRATLLRVSSFRSALLTMDTLGAAATHIDIEESADDALRIDDLRVATPNGCIQLDDPHVRLQRGERAVVVGERGAGRDLLFRALIGIWPWGSGRISRPALDSMMFLPARAYVPPGTLRATVAYPRSAHELDPHAVAQAFTDVGLDRLSQQLDTPERWDRQLNEDEKQCLAFARALLHQPKWLIVNGAFDVLDAASRERIEQLFANQLAGVGLLNIGQDQGQGGFFARRLHLEADPAGLSFSPAEHCAPSPA